MKIPELPECENVVRSIRPFIWGCEIDGLVLSDYGKGPNIDAYDVLDQKINHVWRRGKYIIFGLPRGNLVSHLRMTGQWYFSPKTEPDPASQKYFRWGFKMNGLDDEPSGTLWFKDVRKFGTLDWVEDINNYPALCKLGPDGLDLDNKKTVYEIAAAASRSKRPIKNLLLDQRVIAGCGNIYASESLFEARVNPHTPAKDLAQAEVERLCYKMYEIFLQSIDLGGSSISDFSGGSYHEVLKVYGRAGEDCYDCGSKIERITQAGRSTFFCPKCQGVEESEFF